MPIQQFLNYIKYEKRYSDLTITSYHKDILQFQNFVESYTNHLFKVSSRNIRNWVIALMEEGLQPSSVNRKLSSLKSFYKFLMKEGLIQVNPAKSVKMLKTAQRTPEFVKESEILGMLQNLPPAKTFEEERDILIFEMFYATGMRRVELMELRDESIDLANNVIKVLGKGKKERKIPVHGKLIEKIKHYIKAREVYLNSDVVDVLFVNAKGAPLQPKAVYNIIKQFLDLCGSVEKKSPHVLRHTFATHMLNKGASLNAIKELLGHSSLAATQVYTHNSIDRLKEIHKLAHPKA